jgi:hypothetical protein
MFQRKNDTTTFTGQTLIKKANGKRYLATPVLQGRLIVAS